MIVDQARDDRAALKVNDALCRLDGLISGCEPAVPDQHRIDDAILVVEGVDPAVHEGQLTIVRCDVLGDPDSGHPAKQGGTDEIAARKHGTIMRA